MYTDIVEMLSKVHNQFFLKFTLSSYFASVIRTFQPKKKENGKKEKKKKKVTQLISICLLVFSFPLIHEISM